MVCPDRVNCAVLTRRRNMKDQTASRRVFGVFCIIALSALLILAVGCRKKPGEAQQTTVADQEGASEQLPNYLRKEKTILHEAVEIGGKEFDAYLGSKGRREFALVPKGASGDKAPRWWGASELNSLHLINGKYYGFSTNKSRDRLFVNEYSGQLGKLVAGKGDRDIASAQMSGSLRSTESAVAVGPVSEERGWSEKTSDCMLPVGDYLPAYMSFDYGRVSFSVSNNYHNDVQGRGTGDRPKVYGIKIRPDKPFILDYSNKPAVVFTTPAKDQRVKVGAEIKVEAVLIDPELDIMIRRLYETVSEGEGKSKKVSLDPKVVITRADGTEVANGVMPFG